MRDKGESECECQRAAFSSCAHISTTHTDKTHTPVTLQNTKKITLQLKKLQNPKRANLYNYLKNSK